MIKSTSARELKSAQVYPKIPTHNRFIRYSGIIATLSFFLICIIVVALNFKSIHYTISYHIGLSLFSIISFAIVSIFTAVCLMINMLFYARKRWPFQGLITVYAVVLSLCLVMVSCFPYAPRLLPLPISVIHRVFATIFFVAPPIFVLIFLFLGRSYGPYYKIPFIIFLAKSIFFLFAIIFYTDSVLTTSLISEALYLSGTITVSQVFSFASNVPRKAIDKKEHK